VLAHFKVARAWDLVTEVNTHASEHGLVSALAPVVDEARVAGDAVAAAILEEAADEFLGAAKSVADRLAMRDEPFGFVLAGGAWKAAPWLASELVRRLPEIAGKATVTQLAVEPVQGAVWLALADARGGFRLPTHVE
jgi:N-acetylglucosamine kinase-like BadF-type ATPase